MAGSIVLWSTTPVPAPNEIVRRLLDQKLIEDGTLRLVVLQTPLDEPQADEVGMLRHQFTVEGVKVEAVDPGVQQRQDAVRAKAVDLIRQAHVIIGTGGSPERMMSVLQDTPALIAIRDVFERGGCVGGGSAGAMVFGVGMPGLGDEIVRFLNWVPLVIAPHFGNYPLDQWKAGFPGETILGIPDTAVAIIENGVIRSVGQVPIEILDTKTGIDQKLAPGGLINLGEAQRGFE